jgi:hypothetical protein
MDAEVISGKEMHDYVGRFEVAGQIVHWRVNMG